MLATERRRIRAAFAVIIARVVELARDLSRAAPPPIPYSSSRTQKEK
jgi:hypothetical protein